MYWFFVFPSCSGKQSFCLYSNRLIKCNNLFVLVSSSAVNSLDYEEERVSFKWLEGCRLLSNVRFAVR